MRVCFVSHSSGKYGAELALLELLSGLTELGVDCKVLVPEKGPLLVALDRLQIEWQVIGYPNWISEPRRRGVFRHIKRTFRTLFWIIPMVRAIMTWRCDVVYTNTAIVSIGALAAWLARRPHVWHLHELGFCRERLFDLGEFAPRLIGYLSAKVLVNSRVVEYEYVRYISPRKLQVIYQAVTLRGENNPPDRIEDKQRFRCAIIGSLHAIKGQHEAIAALAELVRWGIDVELLIVGTGDARFRNSLGQYVKHHGLEEQVIFHGYVENPLPLIRDADVILMCSHFEVFWRVTVEAMLAGKPVIGAASGGTAELIQDGVTGLLYEPGNPNDLAMKIQYLFENPDKVIKLGAAASIWANGRFTQKRYAREVQDLLAEVVARPR